MATADEGNRIRLWELATGRERLSLAGHRGRVTKLLFAEDGKTLISTSSDTTGLVWDLTGLRASGRESRLPQPDPKASWEALADPNAARAYQAIWKLTAAPKDATVFLSERLRPDRRPADKTLARLLADLDSPDFAIRENASQELLALDRLAAPALRKALTEHPSAEQQRRIEESLQSIETAPAGGAIQSLRAVEVLEQIGTQGAKEVVQALAAGAPESRLTQAAKASLQRRARPPRSE